MFKENNSSVFQNMAKKMIKNLQEIEPTDDLNIFAQRIRENTYLDNLIYLMLDNNFDSYNNIINTLYGYVHYFDYDEYALNIEPAIILTFDMGKVPGSRYTYRYKF